MDVPPKLTLFEKIFDVGRPQREMISHMMGTTYQIQILFLAAVQRALFSPAGWLVSLLQVPLEILFLYFLNFELFRGFDWLRAPPKNHQSENVFGNLLNL